jgi:hypothetical protein
MIKLAVDNTQHRQLPLPEPWYERWFFLVGLAFAAFIGAWLVSVALLGLERV